MVETASGNRFPTLSRFWRSGVAGKRREVTSGLARNVGATEWRLGGLLPGYRLQMGGELAGSYVCELGGAVRGV
ncbi:MAG: hypothetical protein V3R87_12410 [Dehalococcoidia bacterium]